MNLLSPNRVFLTVTLLIIQCIKLTSSFHAASTPPLLDVPVFSLSTSSGDDDDAKSTMNILTYASPISIRPDRMWSISLFKGTMSHENFARERRGVLQMLRPEHAQCTDKTGEPGPLIRVLGGSSGRDVDKSRVCAELGYAWERLPQESTDEEGAEVLEWPHVLPKCVYYLKLELVGDLIDCGSHDVALCKVVSMISDEEIESGADELDSLSTRTLREMDIISELGRIKEQ